jgi:saccharopine dehydrogenase (NAD+, L-lysine-forming)
MSKVLVIGAGGVGSVAVHKMAMNQDIFSHISLASRTKSKCDAIAASVKERTGVVIDTYGLDADDVAATTALLNQIKPSLVVNLALPYQDLNIMDACLAAGVHYMDTANYEPRDEAKFELRVGALQDGKVVAAPSSPRQHALTRAQLFAEGESLPR